MTGSTMTCTTKGGDGLAVDFLSASALDLQWENMVKIYLEDAGSHVGKTLKYIATDSFEDGYPNWTDKLLAEFQRFRGYDPKPYLPVLAGRLWAAPKSPSAFSTIIARPSPTAWRTTTMVI